MIYQSSIEELAEKIGRSIYEKEPHDFSEQLKKYGFLDVQEEFEIKDLSAIIKAISRYNFPAGIFIAMNYATKILLKSNKISSVPTENITFSTCLKPDGKFFIFADIADFIIEVEKEKIKMFSRENINLHKIPSLSFELFTISKKEDRAGQNLHLSNLNQSPYEFFSKLYFFIDCAICGMMEYALSLAQKYASERIQGGKPIKDYFAIKEKIYKISEFVNIVSEIIDNLSENPEKIHRKSFFITGFVLRESPILLSEAIQIFGGYGYMKDFKVEKLYREAETLRNLTEIYKLEFFKPE
ncbi:MAG: acyl-CoA dehydrogenase family protein [Candidatus Calescibacterium sp.]|jgi:hypothetical protein|nr:acyl-CoA dehydrogenase family protein [Candidatus Calescibacterium sp.]